MLSFNSLVAALFLCLLLARTKIARADEGLLVLPLTYLPHATNDEALDHSYQRGRHLLGQDGVGSGLPITRGQARTMLGGDTLRRGYYYASLLLGTPGQPFIVVVDSGSTTLYVPCNSCTHCGHHKDPYFATNRSSTYNVLACDDPRCTHAVCDDGGQCMMVGGYAEGSTTKGLLSTDVLRFPGYSTMKASPVVFECESQETGLLYKQWVDGVMGLGRGGLSIVSQLASAGVMNDSFALCFGGSDINAGGALILGDLTAPPDMIFAPLEPRHHFSHFYSIQVESMQVGGEDLDVDDDVWGSGFGEIMDSGTTYTMLPREVHRALVKALVYEVDLPLVRPPHRRQRGQPCWANVGTIWHAREVFPSVRFVFKGGAVLELEPENYLIHHLRHRGAYCLGIYPNRHRGSLIGGITTRNMLVLYDRVNDRVGFAKRDCKHLLEKEWRSGQRAMEMHRKAPSGDEEGEEGDYEDD